MRYIDIKDNDGYSSIATTLLNAINAALEIRCSSDATQEQITAANIILNNAIAQVTKYLDIRSDYIQKDTQFNKILRDDQIYILSGDRIYTIQGQLVQ